MNLQKTTLKVFTATDCPLYRKEDVFVLSGIALLMDRKEGRSLVLNTVIHDPPGRRNCPILSGDLNRLVITHERADLIPEGLFPCSGCTGTISLEHSRAVDSELDVFLNESEQPAGLLHLLKNFPFFSNIDQQDLENVVGAFTLENISKNQIILRRGDPGDNFYIIVSGQVSVLNENGIVIATLSAGEVFGEMSLLSDEQVSATIQAAQDSEIMYVDNREFRKILDRYPLLQQYFSRLLAKRLSRSNSFRSIDFVSIMTGKLEEFPPEALFQSLHAARKTGILTVSQLPDGPARFSLRQGGLIRAAYGSRKGKKAFYDILREKKGIFKFTPGLPPEDFDAPELGYFMKLLMVGLQKADQKNRAV